MGVTDEYQADFAIEPVDRGTPIQTSSQQRRIWFADQFDASGLQYIYGYDVRLRGTLDLDALNRAIDLLIVRHETLRTRIVAVDGEPWQVTNEPYVVDLTPVPVAGQSELDEAVSAFVNRRFDFAEGRFLRAVLFQLAEDDHVLVLTIHHIATDGWSNAIIMGDLAASYNAFASDAEPDLVQLRVQHGDYARGQFEWLAGGGAKGHLAYWRKQLAGAQTMLDLPVDRPWPEAQSFRGDSFIMTVPRGTALRAQQLGEAEHASLFMVLLAAFQLTLARWTGQDDLIVGTGAANRAVGETEHLVGPFINMLPLRARIDESAAFRSLLQQVRDTVFDAFDHVAAPFDRIVEEISPERSLARNSVIQVTLTEASGGSLALDGLKVEPLEGRLKTVRFDLTFYYTRMPDGGLQVEANYATDILDRDTVEALADRFVATLESVLEAPDVPLCTMPAVTPAELAVVQQWGAGEPAQGVESLVHEEIARLAACEPDRVAVIVNGRNKTFAQLDAQADKIAGLLGALGVGVETPVGVMIGRSEGLVAAILGVLKAGAYYVPLDPAYPAERLVAMLHDSGIGVVLTDGAVIDDADGWPLEVRFVPLSEADTADPAAPKELAAGNLAYAIYTSGSTGGPKPVLVTHGDVMDLLRGLEAAGIAGPEAGRVGWNASSSFDASVQQWVRLARGDTLVLITEAERSDPLVLADLIRSAALTHLDITPTHLELLIDHLPPAAADRSPLLLLIGGEAIRPGLWDSVSRLVAAGAAKAVNLYGPTETTVDATAAWIVGGSPAIGGPLPGRRVAVLDPWFRPVPPGVVGELAIGGVGLARGYGGRPGLTAARFIADPFRSDGSRLYRSGDRVRWRADGTLEYMGRSDRQVKLRGFRIELSEVEMALGAAPGVGQVLAMVRELPGGSGLVAYCGSAGADPVDPAAVRAYVTRRLPTFMVPEIIVPLDVLPFGPGGKVDEAQLPDPADYDGDGSQETLLGPIEALVGEVWRQILGVERVGPSDNFFALGGHSMQATRMIALIRKRISLSLPVTAIFKYPRLRALSQHIEAIIRERMRAEAKTE